MVGCQYSGLLQCHQCPLWSAGGILHGSDLSCHESWTKSEHFYSVLIHSSVQYEYLWADGIKYRKPVRLSAPQYMEKLFDWIEVQVRHLLRSPCNGECVLDG